jgi:hypothetical protein
LSLAFHERFCQTWLFKLDHPVFTSLDFITVIFLKGTVVSLTSSPQTGGSCLYICPPPSNRVAQLYPQTLGYFFIAFYDSQDYDVGILTCYHKGHVLYGCDLLPHFPTYNEASRIKL